MTGCAPVLDGSLEELIEAQRPARAGLAVRSGMLEGRDFG